jgi:hypothetical protein
VQQQLVVRLYEPHGCRGRAALLVGGGLQVVRAALGNLLEDVQQELRVGRTTACSSVIVVSVCVGGGDMHYIGLARKCTGFTGMWLDLQ